MKSKQQIIAVLCMIIPAALIAATSAKEQHKNDSAHLFQPDDPTTWEKSWQQIRNDKRRLAKDLIQIANDDKRAKKDRRQAIELLGKIRNGISNQFLIDSISYKMPNIDESGGA